MFSFCLLSVALASAQSPSFSDYDKAWKEAVQQKKDLVIYFRKDDRLDKAFTEKSISKRLGRFVVLIVPPAYEHKGKRLLDHEALDDMNGKAGLAVVSLHDDKLPQHNQLISALPFESSRYDWVPEVGSKELAYVLDLPKEATLSQRSMIFGLLVHPEKPRSILARANAAFLGHAARHSARQASLRNQHHADLIATMGTLSNEMGEHVGAGSEVVAESWGTFVGGENVQEAAYSCIDAWRHSAGHWSAVSGSHRYFGYDIAKGSNGTWYATGIFAD